MVKRGKRGDQGTVGRDRSRVLAVPHPEAASVKTVSHLTNKREPEGCRYKKGPSRALRGSAPQVAGAALLVGRV